MSRRAWTAIILFVAAAVAVAKWVRGLDDEPWDLEAERRLDQTLVSALARRRPPGNA
jgi:hypothetical protein